MTQFLQTVTGEEPYEYANSGVPGSEKPITFENSKNKMLKQLDDRTKVSRIGFNTYRALSRYIKTLNAPKLLNHSLFHKAILKQSQGLELEGVGPGQKIPSAPILNFFTRIACLEPKLRINNKQFSTTHLIAIELANTHNLASLTYFCYHFNIVESELQKTVYNLNQSKLKTLGRQAASKIGMATKNTESLKHAERQALSTYLERGRLEKFQSSAGNLLNDPNTLQLIYGVFGAGISALNAFLQTAGMILANKGNILKNPKELWKGIMRYYIFKKLFSKAFSSLSGVPSMTAQESDMVKKALDNVGKIASVQDMFKGDKTLPKETAFQFYKTHESSHKDFITSQNFLNFMRNLFIDDKGHKQTTAGGARVDANYIKERIKEYAKTLNGADQLKFKINAEALFKNATKQTGTEEFASMQFVLLSMAIISANVSSPKNFTDLIHRHHG